MAAPSSVRLALTVLAAAFAALALPLAAGADDDPREEARSEGKCSGSSEIELRLDADDGAIRVELEIDTRRRGSTWNVILLHERRTAFRGLARTRGGGSLELRRTVADWSADTIVARATGLWAEPCRVSATL